MQHMDAPNARLKFAREQRGYETASAAAEAMGVPVSTYTMHEKGSRGFRSETARQYADFLRTTPEWLLYGRSPESAKASVPLVGFVGAGSQAFLFAASAAKAQVEPPPGATSTTRAVEIRSEDGFGSSFDGWLAFFDEADQGPVTPKHCGELCLCCLPDGKILVKKLQRSGASDRFHLTSGLADPLFDQQLVWAARIVCMKPR